MPPPAWQVLVLAYQWSSSQKGAQVVRSACFQQTSFWHGSCYQVLLLAMAPSRTWIDDQKLLRGSVQTKSQQQSKASVHPQGYQDRRNVRHSERFPPVTLSNHYPIISNLSTVRSKIQAVPGSVTMVISSFQWCNLSEFDGWDGCKLIVQIDQREIRACVSDLERLVLIWNIWKKHKNTGKWKTTEFQ